MSDINYNHCAFPFLELQHPDKGLIKIPLRQYQMNEKQQFAVIAIDFSEGVELGDHEDIKYQPMGKLKEQNFIFYHQILNSLTIQEWDFDAHPNPEIIMITIL